MDPTANIFEVVMLLCFGVGWPFAVIKTVKTKQADGKSLLFLTFIFIGYLSGVLYKITTDFDFVIFFYALNGSMVLAEIILCLRYQHYGLATTLKQAVSRNAAPAWDTSEPVSSRSLPALDEMGSRKSGVSVR